jgi:hypothetical protein
MHPNVSISATAILPLAATARRNMTHPQRPGVNWVAPSGFSSDQSIATGECSNFMA